MKVGTALKEQAQCPQVELIRENLTVEITEILNKLHQVSRWLVGGW